MKQSAITSRLAVTAAVIALLATGCTTEADRKLNQYRLRREQGFIAERDGDPVEAESRYKQALVIAENSWGERHPNTAASLVELGLLYHRQREYSKAAPLFERAVAVRRKILGVDDLAVADALMFEAINNLALAKSLDDRSRRDLAIGKTVESGEALKKSRQLYGLCEKQFKDALSIREKKDLPDSLNVAGCLDHLSGCYWSQGRYVEAEPLLLRALSIRQKKPKKARAERESCLSNLAAVEFELGKYKESEQFYKQAIDLKQQIAGMESVSLAGTLDNYANVLSKLGRQGDAAEVEARARRIRAKSLAPQVKQSFEKLARAATLHILDTSYSTYRQSQQALAAGEISADLLAHLKALKMVPSSPKDLESRLSDLKARQELSEVRIDSVKTFDPDHQWLVPIEVAGLLVVSSKGDKKAARSIPFVASYLVGADAKSGNPAVAALSIQNPAKPLEESPKVGTTTGAPPGGVKR